jgi:hypothetical protein
MDVDSIELGDNFAEVVSNTVGSCSVLLALIGRRWLTDAEGKRRVDDPGDFVRLEIEIALAHGLRVIPILFDGATMPTKSDLPTSIATLARCHALKVSADRFSRDLAPLIEMLDDIVLPQRPGQGGHGSQAQGYQLTPYQLDPEARPQEGDGVLRRPVSGYQLPPRKDHPSGGDQPKERG